MQTFDVYFRVSMEDNDDEDTRYDGE